MGRPKKRPSPGDYDKVFALASVGAGKGTTARRVNVSLGTFNRWLAEYPRISEAWEAGGAEMESDLVRNLFEIAMDKKHPRCVIAAFFLLKSKRGFIDNPQPAPEESRVRVEVVLPAALSEQQYRELLDVTPKRKLIEEG